ncbi:DnaA regulatory inactivator Hda [Methylobacter sp. YRD-M1]|uniref:DnaA regulatory inactivator Hda n=1 Tax=Methylobacter sp. YRD-M1 TaxID=2911520 RepID=UPI002279FFA9|nr:DnaA regulatory inactivator Hda [Methylobacter sp. YRD-M1]WAK01719.1 DnaA regulatory inactivator Hda [Methylobacter sp. YRD-M1]
MAKQLPLHFEFRANQTFNNFYPGENEEIINHLQNCIAGTGEQLIFLWGNQGLGKSHLLQACCCQAYALGLSSFYFSFSRSALPDPIMLNGLDEIDIVCFDNIEHLAGDPTWEMAFFNFFNEHRDRGHKLILSAHRAPNDIAIQLPDLKTRLNWGLALKIQPLADHDRIAALTFKANQMGFEISPKAGRFLLTHYARDLASLWALLEKLDQASLAAKRKLTIPFLKQIMDDNHV